VISKDAIGHGNVFDGVYRRPQFAFSVHRSGCIAGKERARLLRLHAIARAREFYANRGAGLEPSWALHCIYCSIQYILKHPTRILRFSRRVHERSRVLLSRLREVPRRTAHETGRLRRNTSTRGSHPPTTFTAHTRCMYCAPHARSADELALTGSTSPGLHALGRHDAIGVSRASFQPESHGRVWYCI
jgi:hypothetical protein